MLESRLGEHLLDCFALLGESLHLLLEFPYRQEGVAALMSLLSTLLLLVVNL